MTALAVIFVFLGFAVLLGGGFLAAAAGHAWALVVALVIFLALFVWYGCLPSSDH